MGFCIVGCALWRQLFPALPIEVYRYVMGQVSDTQTITLTCGKLTWTALIAGAVM